MNICDSKVSALIREGEALVVDAHEPQDRCLEIVNVNRTWRELVLGRKYRLSIRIDNVVAVVIGFTIGRSRVNSTTGHEDREASWMVISTEFRHRERTLGIACPSKFSAPNDQRILKHSKPLEILDQRRRWTVGISSLNLDAIAESAVLIPSLVVELNEPNSLLSQPPCQQAVRGKSSWSASFSTVEFKDLIGFFAQIGDFWHAGLHSIRHLVLRNSAFNLWIKLLLKVDLIQLAQSIEHRSTTRLAHPVRIGEVEYWLST